MLRLELDILARAIRDTPMSHTARINLVRKINTDLSAVNPLHNAKRLRSIALPLEK